MSEPQEEESGIELASVGRAAGILTAGAALGQLLGLVREFIVADRLGVSPQYDAFLVATSLPSSAADLLTIGLATALVPAYVAARRHTGLDSARSVAGGLLAWVTIAAALLSVLVYTFADAAVSITGPGLSAEGRAEAVDYIHALAPVTVALSITGMLYAVAQAERRFVALALASLATSVTVVACLLALWDRMGLGSLAVGTVLGPIAGMVVLLVSLARGGLLPRPTLRVRGLGFRAIWDHAAPLTVGTAIAQLLVLTDRAVATLVGDGALSMLRYGEVLVRAPITAIRGAWGAALYPALVEATQGGPAGSLARATERSLHYIFLIFVPIAALTAAVAPVAVEVAFGRGAFSPEDVRATAPVVAAFAPIIPISMAAPVLRGAHNARRQGRVLLIAGMVNASLNLVFDVLFGYLFGAAGIALSSALTTTVVLVVLARRLTVTDPTFDARSGWVTALRASAASAPPALVIAVIAWGGLVPTGLVAGAAALLAFGAAGMLGYAVLARSVGLEEPMAIVRWLIAFAGRPRRGGGAKA